jgi:hypothetical protein
MEYRPDKLEKPLLSTSQLLIDSVDIQQKFGIDDQKSWGM